MPKWYKAIFQNDRHCHPLRISAGIVVFSIGWLSGCSGSGEAARPSSHTVTIAQMQFQPPELTVKAGDTVVWINKDIVTHNITQWPDSTWKSSDLPGGKSWSLVVERGTEYYCSIHLVMKGKLIVK